MTTYETLVLIIMSITTIAIVIAPVLGELVAARVNQPKVSPIANQPAKRSPDKGGRFQRWAGTIGWLGWLVALIMTVYWLLAAWRSPEPVTNKSVIKSAFLVGFLIMLLLSVLIRLTMERLLAFIVSGERDTAKAFLDVMAIVKDMHKDTSDRFEDIIAVFGLVTEYLNRVENRLPVKDAPTLNKMLVGLKKLMTRSGDSN